MKSENLGFAFIGAGMLVLIVALWAIPLQAPLQIPAPVKSVAKVQTQQFTPKENVLVAAFRHGWTGVQWDCLNELIAIENPGWLPDRKNPQSTATGIFQVLRSPTGRWFYDYSVADQARLGTKYIAYRYGNPCRALTFHLLHGYF